MLLTVHVQVDLAKRCRERTGSYPDGRGNGRSVHQITIKNVQVQLTVKGKTTPDSYTPTPKRSCAQNVVVLK
jgi:hypothetical protein